MFDISTQRLVIVQLVVVQMLTMIIHISDATVVRARGELIWLDDAEVVVRVACTRAARVDERRVVSAFDEVTSRVNIRKKSSESLIQWVVAVRQCYARIYNDETITPIKF